MRVTGEGSQDRLPVILLFLGIHGYFCISCQKPSSLVVSPGLVVSLDLASPSDPVFFSENPVFFSWHLSQFHAALAPGLHVCLTPHTILSWKNTGQCHAWLLWIFSHIRPI